VPAVRPDVTVVDMRLPDGDGAEVCRKLRQRVPGLRCLVLTSFPDEDAVAAAVAAGASGYVLKQVRGSALVTAVRTVADGGTLFDRDAGAGASARRRPAERDRRLAVLTEQERTVLRLIGEGLTNRQIGVRMGLAEKTVKNYTSHLLAKLGLERRTQAAILATELRDRPE
jgi:DNA-binding NarL/FixJ family response regulator